jgi:hypothetical protein
VPRVLAAVLARQPLTPAKVAFAWQMAVGPALARMTTVESDAGVLRVKSTDVRWTREIERSRPLLLSRLEQLLGAGVITEIRIS